MTKQTYEERVEFLDCEDNGGLHRREVAKVAEDADNEIKNLKRLLQASVYFVRTLGMFDSLATEIEEVLNDD